MKIIVNGTKIVRANNIEGIKAFMKAWTSAGNFVESYRLVLNNGNEYGSKHPVNASADFATVAAQL